MEVENKLNYNDTQIYVVFLIKTQNLNNMEEVNKNTELENTDKKLHISDVSDSTKSQYKAHFIDGFENHAKLLAMKMERYEKFVKFYQLK